MKDPPRGGEPAMLSHVTIEPSDLERAIRFYDAAWGR